MGFELVDFRKDVVEACKTVPVVIDFWAEWCGPCKILGPVIEKLAVEAKGRWKLVKIDTDRNPQIAQQFAIQGIPAVKMVYQGKIVAEFTGALPEHKIREWLKEHLPAMPEPEPVQSLDEILAGATRSNARGYLEKLVKEDASNKDNRAKLAMYLLPDRVADAQQLLSDATESKYEIERETVKTVLHLKEFSLSGSAPAGSTSISNQYADAVKAFFAGEYDLALETFIRVIALDRTFDEDGARKACVAIFAMLGETHPVTKNWRRRFSMSLY